MTNDDHRPGDDPWAQREAGFRLYVEPPAVAFFIPGVDDPADAEAQWARFVQGQRPDCRRVYSLTYFNGISKIEVKVGEERMQRRPETGPRGGHLPGGGLSPVARPTGSRVLAIVDAGTVLEVWSEPPPGEWANPSQVSPARSSGGGGGRQHDDDHQRLHQVTGQSARSRLDHRDRGHGRAPAGVPW